MTASIAGVPFDINPKSISWDYKIKMKSTKTLGGKVIQVYGSSLGDLTISGFSRSQKDHLDFFKRVKKIVDSHVPSPANDVPQPVQFLWPDRGWDFMVYIKSLQQIGASTSYKATNKDFAPQWTMTMFIDQDNSDVIRAASESAKAAYINRIAKTMGWKQTEWNGPLLPEDVVVTEP